MTGSLDAGARRLPVYLLLDCSGSMAGDPIEAVARGLGDLISELRGDPQALETVWLSVITFASQAEQVVPLTEVGAVERPPFEACGRTALGAALDLLAQCIESEVRQTTAEQKGDWKPLAFLMTDGLPTDSWEEPSAKLKQKQAEIIACAAGDDADVSVLKRIADLVVRLEDRSQGSLAAFMQWVTTSVSMVSAAVSTGARARGAGFVTPPEDRRIVIVP